MEWIFLILLSYFLGAINFSFIIVRILKKVDIRDYGSGNAGATNTMRLLGTGPAIIVLLLDCAKGIVAVAVTLQLTDSLIISGLAGLAAIIGHNWPVYYGFRGGKGVATTIGVLATLTFLPALLVGIVAISLIAITRYVSIGSLLFIGGTPLLILVFNTSFDYPLEIVYIYAIIFLLSLFKHRSNIHRLWNGNEKKLGEKELIS